MNTQDTLFSLLRNILRGGKERVEVSSEMLPGIFSLADCHDLAHLAGQALSDLGLLGQDEISEKLRQKTLHAVYRYARQNYELERICAALEAAQIPFIPLKGSVLRAYYPQGWMRTCCDIDVLVKPEDLDGAEAALVQKLEYTRTRMSSHDITLNAPSGVHLELHYDTIEDDEDARSGAVLARVWETALPAPGKSFHMTMPDELFYFYHISHMAKHVKMGGCGIRPLMDLWILDHRMEHDGQKRRQLLEEGGLLPFWEAVRNLSESWFSGGKVPDHFLERYILRGGVYGSVDNKVAVRQTANGGKLGYALRRVFQPYDSIKYYYPVLQKHKWLLPVFWVVRWFRLLFKGGVKRSVRELSANAGMPEEERLAVDTMLEQLGLQEK